MRNVENRKNDKHNSKLQSWKHKVGLVGSLVLLFVVVYYRAHPKQENHQVAELIAVGVGIYLIFTAIIGLRNGEISGTVTSYKFKREKDAPTFWFTVGTNFLFGIAAILLVAAILLGILK